MSSIYTATDAAAYEALMGRWSPLLAEALVAFAGVAAGDEVLDLGCGTGSLALLLAERAPAQRILGIDIAAPYIAHAATRAPATRASPSRSAMAARSLCLIITSTAAFRCWHSTSWLHRRAPSPRCGA